MWHPVLSTLAPLPPPYSLRGAAALRPVPPQVDLVVDVGGGSV